MSDDQIDLKDAVDTAQAAYDVELLVAQVRINAAIMSGKPYLELADFIEKAVEDLRQFAQRLVVAKRAYRERAR